MFCFLFLCIVKQCWNLDFYSCAKTALNASVWHPEREDVVFVGGFDDPKRVSYFVFQH